MEKLFNVLLGSELEAEYLRNDESFEDYLSYADEYMYIMEEDMEL